LKVKIEKFQIVFNDGILVLYSRGILSRGVGGQLVHLYSVDVHEEESITDGRVRSKQHLVPEGIEAGFDYDVFKYLNVHFREFLLDHKCTF
jgi:hypothetical protein